MSIDNLSTCLQPSRFINSDHPDIVAKVKALTKSDAPQLDNAVALYYWARDSIRYNPYALDTDPGGYLASTTLAAGEGWCVTKAILLAALCRAADIPARVGYADVRNHLSTQRLRESMGTDVFYFHGYTSLYLQGRWVKATPAFNVELCTKFGLHPLEFNGLEDSLYHEFDVAGNRHMEYVNERGDYLDLPFGKMAEVFREHYPNLFCDRREGNDSLPSGNEWDRDVAREVCKP